MAEVALKDKGGLELLVELERNGAISRTGLHLFDPNLSYERAEALGSVLGEMGECIKFATGDWLLLIEKLFPERWSQLSEVVGHNEEYRRELMRVAECVPQSLRRDSLRWSHHRAVASLEAPAQQEWLERAESEQLSHHSLRAALRESGPHPPSDRPALCRCCGREL